MLLIHLIVLKVFPFIPVNQVRRRFRSQVTDIERAVLTQGYQQSTRIPELGY